MNVTLKNKEIDDGLILIQPFIDRGLPVKVSFAIGKTLRKLKGVIELMTDERKKLVEKHQMLDDDGKRIEEDGGIKLKSAADFSDDFNELMKAESEVDVHQIDLEELDKMKDRDGKKLLPTPSEMEGLLLLQMIKEKEEKPKEDDSIEFREPEKKDDKLPSVGKR